MGITKPNNLHLTISGSVEHMRVISLPIRIDLK